MISYFQNEKLIVILSVYSYQMYLDDDDGEINGLEVYDAAEIGKERTVYT